ncbi:MAG: cAMP receptor protein [Syntrophaceae bacterium PtaU1.Bin231]|jgi:CRP-like cAMP-binding protein|nr:MAG: cAMP receptor protein [Syntrophaceae bacterium PtaU1.Bin231]HOG17832.1 Crp/Fnr family transcriptional regulator [Syntrophales bacterium]
MSSIDLLKQIPLFEALQPADRNQLASLLRLRLIVKGNTLFRKGDEGTALYIILQGSIKISISGKAGEEVALAILGRGDFFGEMALLDGLPRSADAVALEDSHLYVLNRRDFLSFLIQNEAAVQAILFALSLRLRRTDDLLQEVCFLNLSVRLARRLLDLARRSETGDGNRPYEVRLSHKELSGLFGVTRESISKELRVLRNRGIVSTMRNRVLIHDIDALKQRSR